MLPNCILESTLLGREFFALREQVTTHSMVFFDGEKWMEVQLPEELLNAADNIALYPVAVTSDCILLSVWDNNVRIPNFTKQLYQIRLDTDTPVLEYLGEIGEDYTGYYNQ